MRFHIHSIVFLLLLAAVRSHRFDVRQSCSAAPEQIEGPYWLDGALVRSDIRDGQSGVPIYLNLILLNASATSLCQPLSGAAADIWHTNATGYYGHFTGQDPDKPPIVPAIPTDNLTFCRGVQITDKNGVANFTTIYPGWYYGRSEHQILHFEVHLHGSVVDGKFVSGGSDAYTGQFFFDDSWTAQIAKLPPYNTHTTLTYTKNTDDWIYLEEGGANNLLPLVPIDPDNLATGFTTTFVLNVDTSELQYQNAIARRQTFSWKSYDKH